MEKGECEHEMVYDDTTGFYFCCDCGFVSEEKKVQKVGSHLKEKIVTQGSVTARPYDNKKKNKNSLIENDSTNTIKQMHAESARKFFSQQMFENVNQNTVTTAIEIFRQMFAKRILRKKKTIAFYYACLLSAIYELEDVETYYDVIMKRTKEEKKLTEQHHKLMIYQKSIMKNKPIIQIGLSEERIFNYFAKKYELKESSIVMGNDLIKQIKEKNYLLGKQSTTVAAAIFYLFYRKDCNKKTKDVCEIMSISDASITQVILSLKKKKKKFNFSEEMNEMLE